MARERVRISKQTFTRRRNERELQEGFERLQALSAAWDVSTRQAPRRKPKPVGFKDAFAKRLDLAKLPPQRARLMKQLYHAQRQAPGDLHKGFLNLTVDDEDTLNFALLELLQALIAGDYASNKDTSLHGRQSLYGKLLATALIEGMPDVDASEFCHGMRIIHPDYLDSE